MIADRTLRCSLVWAIIGSLSLTAAGYYGFVMHDLMTQAQDNHEKGIGRLQTEIQKKDREIQKQKDEMLPRFQSLNRSLSPSPGTRVVFLGDSIFERWDTGSLFTDPTVQVVNRGIGGQAAHHMLGRFFQDVIDLKPDILVLMAGTNDVLNDGDLDQAKTAIKTMVTIASSAKIKVIVCTITPVVTEDAQLKNLYSTRLKIMNRNIRAVSAETGCALVNFHDEMLGSNGEISGQYFSDIAHPNSEGYKKMKTALFPALKKLRPSL